MKSPGPKTPPLFLQAYAFQIADTVVVADSGKATEVATGTCSRAWDKITYTTKVGTIDEAWDGYFSCKQFVGTVTLSVGIT